MKKTKNRSTKSIEKLPFIRVLETKENADGSLSMSVEYDKAFEFMVKTALNKSKITKKQMGDFLINVLEKAANKEDGYDIKYAEKKKEIEHIKD